MAPPRRARNSGGFEPGEREQELLDAWEQVIARARTARGYDASLTYGIYQIGEELDESWKDDDTGATVYLYPELHGAVKAVKELVKRYYLDEIAPVLFEYEFLK